MLGDRGTKCANNLFRVIAHVAATRPEVETATSLIASPTLNPIKPLCHSLGLLINVQTGQSRIADFAPLVQFKGVERHKHRDLHGQRHVNYDVIIRFHSQSLLLFRLVLSVYAHYGKT